MIGILRKLGVTAGSVMLVEAPGADLEQIKGGLPALFDMLLSVVSPGGTLAVPTCTPLEGYPKPAFNSLLSQSEAGPFSEFFRRQPDVVRSHNATHSVAARGPASVAIVKGHRSAYGRPTPWGETPFGHNSPWDVLAQMNAWWIMIDADWKNSPFITYVRALCAEKYSNVTRHTPFPRFNGALLEKTLEGVGVLKSALWDGRKVVAFRTRPALDIALEILEKEPEKLEPDEEFRLWLAGVERIRRYGYLKAGTAKVVITPPLPCARWDGKPLTGVHRDLYARVLVLSSSSGYLALVLCDLLGISKDLTDRIRNVAGNRTSLNPGSIMVACTHAHSTPDTVGAGNGDSGYMECLERAIVDGICRATQNMQPARIGWGRVPIRGLAHSRRFTMADGRVFTTRYSVPSTWRVKPELIVGKGSIDPDLTVIRVENLDGGVLAAVSNFGCHASVALMSTNVSGDFPGEAMHTLEEALGDSVVVLASNGSAADVDPTLEIPLWGPRNDKNATRLGRIFAAQVLECLERVETGDDTTIRAGQMVVDVLVRDDWVHMVEKEQERLHQEFASVDLGNNIIERILQNRSIRTEVQVLRLNDLSLVGFPGEVFTTTGLKLKERTPGRKASVVELANDYLGYVLTPEAEKGGGYETGLHMFTRVRADAEDKLLDAAMQVMERLLAE